jgi:CRP-like cAMP-binding protein
MEEFETLAPRQYEALFGKSIQLPRGQFLINQGQPCNYFWFLEYGMLRSYFTQNAEDYTENFYFDRQFVVRFESLSLNKASSANIQVMSNAQLRVIDQQLFDEMKKTYPQLQEIEITLYSCHISWMQQHLRHIQTGNAQTHYQWLIKHQSHYTSRLPVVYLASYMHINQQTLSRVRTRHSKGK